ncbi:MAG TPA: hypothetical protein VFC10_07465 [Terriglobia bacterium]|nr:hypothetical protein [Terracidiphilus sp.]HZT69572.1 hypothetical protein [Terriglobia bacterium]
MAKRYGKAPSDYFPSLTPAWKWELDLACFVAGCEQDAKDIEAAGHRSDVINL